MKTTDSDSYVVVPQFDGNASCKSSDFDTTHDTSDDSALDYDTDDEYHPINDPPVLQPKPSPSNNEIEVDLSNIDSNTSLPLVVVLNCRSAYNKRDSLRTLLHTVSPDFLLASETWSRENFSIQELLYPTPYKASCWLH